MGESPSSVGYVLDAPLVPYKQLSQTYWVQSASRLWRERLGFNLRFTYNSARSGMQPDLNPSDAALMGNQNLMLQDRFAPDLFGAALSTGFNGDPNQGVFKLAATKISQVIVPEYLGQAKIHYALPRNLDSGLLFYYGSYRDGLNPNLDGVIRTFTFYVSRSW